MNHQKEQLKPNKASAELDTPAEPTRPEAVGSVRSTSDPEKGIQQYKQAVRAALECEYSEFLYGQTMGSWKDWMRVGQIAKELGISEEQQAAAQDEVYDEFEKAVDPRHWKIFLHGTYEEMKALQNEIHQEIESEMRRNHPELLDH